MPQTEITIERNPQMAGGERRTQQAANQTESAAGPAKAQQAEAQQFSDLTPGSPPEGVELQDPRQLPEQVPSYGDEDQEFLFGATSRPNDPVNSGATSQKPVPPQNAYKYLQKLSEAAEDPDAPEQLHAFIRLLQNMLGAE